MIEKLTTSKILKLPFVPKRILDNIKTMPPKRILFWKIDTDLNRLGFMQRKRLMEAISKGDLFYSIYSELTNVPKWALNRTSVKKTFPFVKLVIENLKWRNKRDESLAMTYTTDEINAGIKKLGHGDFGIIDSLVRRYCGTYNHDEIYEWTDNRVYAVLKIDVDNIKFQRKLNKIQNEKLKYKKK